MTPLNTEEEIDKIFAELWNAHQMSEYARNSDYIEAKQAIKALLNTHVREARVDELERCPSGRRRSSYYIDRLKTLTNDKRESS